jgi:hypothetical protein
MKLGYLELVPSSFEHIVVHVITSIVERVVYLVARHAFNLISITFGKV